jgi:serine/threonine protein kinase
MQSRSPFEWVADYRLLERLGSGGFADTYRAEKDGEQYAVKVLRELPMGNDAVRFEREIETLRLEHDNLVRYVDRDTTAHDGLFNEAFGHARCKRGERLISGGSGGVLPGQNVSMVESGPVPKLREWKVTMNSDLGGLARKDFVVFAYCRG